MFNTSHPGTTPHDIATASDLDSAMGQAGTIGTWAASLAKLLRVAFREVDTDRERAKASIAKASSLLRAQIERSSFDPAHNRLHLEQDAEGQIHSDRVEIRRRREDRREVWAKVSTSTAPSAGRLLHCLIAIDVTRRKQAAEALGDAQSDLAHVARLATMGELAASIVHEINQPISAIATQATACLRWLERDKPDLDKAREGLVRVERDARRARDVVRGLTALAKRSRPQQSEVDIDNAIEEVLSFVRSEISLHGITLHSDLHAGNRSVYGDRVQLQQVLLNLIMNGIEAMRTTTDLPRILSVSSALTVTGGMLMTVEDTGAGLDPAIADRIFDGFFTTKPNGMGLGLSICRSIIEAHGGQIWASPGSPHGAIFQFILPALHEMELHVQDSQPHRQPHDETYPEPTTLNRDEIVNLAKTHLWR
jgi:C4-dicarboxylate-specific signal transduction histidine kinase